MLGAVASRRVPHNNGRMFAQLSAGVALKLAYYRALALAYRFAGRRSDATMANGSWTAGHLRSEWAEFGVNGGKAGGCQGRQGQSLRGTRAR